MFKDIYKDHSVRVSIAFVIIVMILGTFVLPEWMSNNFMYGLSRGLAVLGLMILWRTNLVSFGHALYYGFGAYAVAMSQKYFGITDIFLRFFIAVVAAGLLGFTLGFILRKYREIFFAMLSLAFSMRSVFRTVFHLPRPTSASHALASLRIHRSSYTSGSVPCWQL